MVFEIKGKLIVDDVDSHQSMITMWYEMLKENGMLFVGETKDITSEYISDDE